MSNYGSPFLTDELSKRTVVFGLHMWVVVGIGIGAAFVLVLFLISLWFTSKRSTNHHHLKTSTSIPNTCKEIPEVRIDPYPNPSSHPQSSPVPRPEPNPSSVSTERRALLNPSGEESPNSHQRFHISSGKGRSGDQQAIVVAPEVSHLGWGHWYTLRELEAATNMFSPENVIGEGGYGIVYHGVLQDNTHVAIKNLLNNRGQAEREFKVEVDAIGRVRHKNLVRLLGYCAEGAHRMLVYEYVDNGNMDQWLHGDVGPCSPLTWEIRMNIILGIAKGLMYLHEALEPKVVHRDIKSSNILLDKHWNAKVSDFGLAKLLGAESNYVTTRVMGTFGYVAPEYASSGMLNERSDVYSFGILIMEIISGRNPVDYSRPVGEVNLVEWLKSMVSLRNAEGVLDPRIQEKPSSRSLKRTLLVALKCVDPDSLKRPKMGHVVHMLEVDDFAFNRDDRRGVKDLGRPNSGDFSPKLEKKPLNEPDSGDFSTKTSKEAIE
ncbi:LOW QUALITY PROTEIN: probable serine/threonine-protein kinase At1g01540 [Dioscorea cayenensis subsp. rotundata]|uniref:non-specific serine/threonine protein kinase n=1 Tax=Dioscorea cayennensis subsp. rotundata TaxID=55577 RepID=A0AB40AYV8_DIOCR|nr:LOW QUALITY PROTEIN: probable serine/threonine-protein kinase At1g01540 [Dioscorea cayenensis subsp. rotundata]